MSSNGAAPDGVKTAAVLICDDNDALRVLLREVIDTGLGMRVVGEAANGDEAVLEATRLQPNVILLDLAMPVRSGLEALPELRLVAPEARIIVFSGFSSSTVAGEVIALGAASYLEKGASPDTIVATIEQALHQNGASPRAEAAPNRGAEIRTRDLSVPQHHVVGGSDVGDLPAAILPRADREDFQAHLPALPRVRCARLWRGSLHG